MYASREGKARQNKSIRSLLFKKKSSKETSEVFKSCFFSGHGNDDVDDGDDDTDGKGDVTVVMLIVVVMVTNQYCSYALYK